MTDRFEIKNPLFLTFLPDDESRDAITHIYPPDGWDHKHYGLVICDLVRHTANALRCKESDLWEWIDKERYKPTSEARRAQ